MRFLPSVLPLSPSVCAIAAPAHLPAALAAHASPAALPIDRRTAADFDAGGYQAPNRALERHQ